MADVTRFSDFPVLDIDSYDCAGMIENMEEW